MTIDDRDRVRALAETEASLRRIAMLVADGAPPETVFDAVTKEALQRFGGGAALMIASSWTEPQRFWRKGAPTGRTGLWAECWRTILRPV